MIILNLGSLNIDRVFRVERIVRPGETISSTSVREFAGGKGANQSVALARAGARVAHLGRIGPDGRWLLDKLAAEDIDTQHIRVGDAVTGQALIQVDDAGENAIVLSPGANFQLTETDVNAAIDSLPAGSWLLAQNETNLVPHAIRRAAERGLHVALNPAPCDGGVRHYPLERLALLCVNETEGAMLSGQTAPDDIVTSLAARCPQTEIVLTLGAAGAISHAGSGTLHCPAEPAQVQDTTAAGDTFLGYYLAARCQGHPSQQCLAWASRAAALCVGRAGAMDSIPRRSEVAFQ